MAPAVVSATDRCSPCQGKVTETGSDSLFFSLLSPTRQYEGISCSPSQLSATAYTGTIIPCSVGLNNIMPLNTNSVPGLSIPRVYA